MCVTRRLISLLAAALLLLQCCSLLVAPVTAQGSPPAATRWQTLSGDQPLVVARGGFSGMFPYGSSAAYQFTYTVSLPDTVLWCDVQLTKDGVGICSSDILLHNNTNILQAFPGRDKQYLLNGVPTSGWFSSDFSSKELSNVVLMQGIYSRTEKFDGNFGIQTVEDVAKFKPAGLWLNIQYDAFYSQHNLSMKRYVISLSRRVVINYISSPEVGFLRSIASRFNPPEVGFLRSIASRFNPPEVGFLRSIASRFNPKVTKLVFQFLHPDDVEPSTNQTYSSLLKNLTFIKTFASGIIIPKDYVWPVDSQSYLLPHTSIVLDAHKAGLEVFASGFYNDVPLSYNYSYDPLTEYLHFINNGDFSVDGVLSDFPITPSEAIACFSHLGRNASNQVDALVITKNGASGDYPGCTDLAYQKAIFDGADVIDCPIQVSSDGIPFCLGSINLFDNTDAASSPFAKLSQTIPELNSGIGLFSFSLKWSEIQQLKPVISNPFSKYNLYRNPKFKNAGSFLKLSDFLALAMNSSLSGVLINIENAPYLIEKQAIPVIDTVLTALSNAGYGNKTAKRVMIQSSNSSVLMKFKGKQEYELVYKIDENIRDALPDTVANIKSFASAVVLNKESIFPVSEQFTTTVSKVVSTLNSSGIPIYAETFSNEFVSQAWDFLSDATVELNSFVFSGNVAGMITGFPLTAARYKKNRCLRSQKPPYMTPALLGALLSELAPNIMPPAVAPYPVLTVSDVAEPPLFDKKAPVPCPVVKILQYFSLLKYNYFFPLFL